MSVPLLPVRQSVTEAYGSLPVPYTTARREDRGWRSTGQNGLGRELPEEMHDRHIVNSFRAYRTNPMGRRLIEMQVNFVIGNGLSVNSKSLSLLSEIQRWWVDPYNQWPARIAARLRGLYIYGEWLHRPLRDSTGFIRIADLQPDAIAAVRADPVDHGLCDMVVLKEIVRAQEVTKEAPIKVIRRRLYPVGDTFELEDKFSGDLFYFGINRTFDAHRGVGELFTVLDYIDLYDDMLFSRAERVKLMSQIYWDLSVDGMTEKELQDFLQKRTDLPPRPGSIFAHNSAMVLTASAPDLKADDHSIDAGILKSHIISTSGWPGIWFDDSGSGRASAQEMTESALRNIINLQAQVGQFLRTEIDYHLLSLRASGLLDASDDEIKDYTISFNRPSARDIQRIGPALGRLIDYVTKATGANLITQSEARNIVVSQANQLSLSDQPIALELPVELEQAEAVQHDAEIAAAANTAKPQAEKKPARESMPPRRSTLYG